MGTETLGLQMAKATEGDMSALLDVVNIIEAMVKGEMPELDSDPAAAAAMVDDWFDPDNTITPLEPLRSLKAVISPATSIQEQIMRDRSSR